jgi:hypothetical protein
VVNFPRSRYDHGPSSFILNYRRDTDEGTDNDFDKMIKDLAKASGTPSSTKMKLQYEMRIAYKTGTTGHKLHGDMNDRESGFFHTQCMSL